MPEINKIGNQPIPKSEQPTARTNDAGGEQATLRGTVGQPIGLPKTSVTQSGLMPEAVTGRDQTQILAAEHLRASGGASATETLLGLNRQPSMLGGLLAPPGNLEALRHLTPVMRRKILRELLAKQRSQMRRLVHVARDEEEYQQQEDAQQHDESNAEELAAPVPIEAAALNFHNQRVFQDLAATTKMLDLLDELLNMQDYTLSQMGTFAQG